MTKRFIIVTSNGLYVVDIRKEVKGYRKVFKFNFQNTQVESSPNTYDDESEKVVHEPYF